ncbi:MAG: hypothetical protein ABIC91_03305 [Nanoarchaeota archaeon]|nr:hypothetical protein [Nanoarchaeota archaeon]MBU1030049.1 hypothetical protein [Nanoarchaeota archaeon]MBU1850137.1 hypothetical protein [Nanoarchaeota archaeon]
MKVVEFMGMPRAGKSTHKELIETFLKHEKKVLTRNIYEGARICPIDKNNRFLYNAWSFHNTMNRVIESKEQKFDYLLIDRGVYDHMAFTQALYKKDYITKSQFQAQIKYFKEFKFLEEIALVFLVTPEESLRRENVNHTYRGRVMNDSFLSALHESYKEILPKIAMDYYIIDGSKKLAENKKEITDFIVGKE